MAWEKSTRRDRLPGDWNKRRAQVKRRANGQCEWVGPPYTGTLAQGITNTAGHHPSSQNDHPPVNGHHPAALPIRCQEQGTDADHIIAGDNHDLSNLQWLCSDHHKHKTKGEARAAIAKQRAKLRHPNTRNQHPGLI